MGPCNQGYDRAIFLRLTARDGVFFLALPSCSAVLLDLQNRALCSSSHTSIGAQFLLRISSSRASLIAVEIEMRHQPPRPAVCRSRSRFIHQRIGDMTVMPGGRTEAICRRSVRRVSVASLPPAPAVPGAPRSLPYWVGRRLPDCV
jgi:hypothetical protein